MVSAGIPISTLPSIASSSFYNAGFVSLNLRAPEVSVGLRQMKIPSSCQRKHPWMKMTFRISRITMSGGAGLLTIAAVAAATNGAIIEAGVFPRILLMHFDRYLWSSCRPQ